MKMMGHRGARDRAPENTLRGFQFLIASGLKAVEFDINESADGVWVVHHDETLNRTTTGHGYIKAKTWSEISQSVIKEGDPIPRLEEVLDLFKETEIVLQIEIKSPGHWQKLLSLLEKYPNAKNIILISFNHRWLLEIKKISSKFKTTCLLFGLPVNAIQIIESAMGDGISLSVNWIDKQLVEACHQKGFLVTAWNANDAETFNKMQDLEIDFLGTDNPYQVEEWKTRTERL